VGINFDVSAHDFKTRELSVTACQVPHGSDKLAKQRTHGDHANAHYFTLQVHVQPLGLAMHLQESASLVGTEFFDHSPQAPLRNHNLPSQVQHVVELVDIGAQRAMTSSREGVGLHG
jgi:hypothetical protein